MNNPVKHSFMSVIDDSKHVKIDKIALSAYVDSLGDKAFSLPDWKLPVFLEGDDDKTIDYFFLGNAINFAFNDFETGVKYKFHYKDTDWMGAFGMWAALKAAVEDRRLSLDGDCIRVNGKPLSQIEPSDLDGILQKDSKIPMFNERVEILREIGKGLELFYGGHASNLISAGRELFGPSGVITRITADFPSFKDISRYGGNDIVFNKRAQLAIVMIYERFLADGQKLFSDRDMNEITVFADYELPKILHALGILTYDSDLENRIQSGMLIERDSEEEVELRANTIYAVELLKTMINAKRAPDKAVNALNIDYLLWSEGRKMKDKKAHMTKTTNY